MIKFQPLSHETEGQIKELTRTEKPIIKIVIYSAAHFPVVPKKGWILWRHCRTGGYNQAWCQF